jgi:hypothetical protein
MARSITPQMKNPCGDEPQGHFKHYEGRPDKGAEIMSERHTRQKETVQCEIADMVPILAAQSKHHTFDAARSNA